MWNWADDYGVGSANHRQLLGFAFPNDDDISVKDLPSLCKEVADCFGIVFFEYKQRPFFVIPSWNEHQRTERRARRDEALHEAAERAVLAHNHAELADVAENLGNSDGSQGSSGAGTGEPGNRGTEEPGNKNPPNPPRGKRGERIDSDWKPMQGTVDTIIEEYPSLDYQREHKRFVDYWIAQPGQKGVKLDWEATWRNWMRRKGDEANTKPSPSERAQRTVALATDLLEVEA